jgi:hypothetical protein
VTGVGASPPTAIGQRALLVASPAGNVLRDMITYIDEDLVGRVRELGGVSAIAISHPHLLRLDDRVGAPVRRAGLHPRRRPAAGGQDR